MQSRPVFSRRSLALLALVSLGATACQSADGSQASPTPTTLTSLAPSTLAQQATTLPSTTTTVPETTTTTTIPETTTTVPETTTTLPETTTTAAPAPAVPAADPPLKAIGTKNGDEAKRAQQRLLDLGFWLSGADGQFGLTTKQAVMAFQKYYGLDRTGKLDQPTADLLSITTSRVQAQATSGSLVEVDKDRQVLMIVHDGITVWAINAASGSGQYYLEENQKKPGTYESGRAVTPSGKFKTNRERPDGWWEGDLGKIYRPKYFNGGIAIHGSGNIPAQPASHGCVRVSVPAMDMIWDSGLIPLGTPVIVSGNDVAPTGPKPTAPPAPPPTAAPDTTVPGAPATPAPPDTTLPPVPETTVAPAPETTAAAPPA